MKDQKYSIGDKVFFNFIVSHSGTIADIKILSDDKALYKFRYKDGIISYDWFKENYFTPREDLL